MAITNPFARTDSTQVAFRAGLAATILAALFTGTVSANPLSDTHIFRAGVYEQNIDVKASFTRAPHPEQEIDFDKILGVDESATSYFLQYQWRFAKNWDLSAFYTTLDADGKKRATRDFNWDGQDYTAGAQLGTELSIDTYLVTVDYSFFRDERKEFGLGFGVHAFDLDTTIEIKVDFEEIDGEDGVTGRAVRTNSELLAPLPNIRAYGRYLITPDWALLGSMGWLSANYDDYDGDYLFLTLMTEYRFTENFGVGFSYQISEIDITHDGTRTSKHFDVDQYGPSIYLTYGF